MSHVPAFFRWWDQARTKPWSGPSGPAYLPKPTIPPQNKEATPPSRLHPHPPSQNMLDHLSKLTLPSTSPSNGFNLASASHRYLNRAFPLLGSRPPCPLQQLAHQPSHTLATPRPPRPHRLRQHLRHSQPPTSISQLRTRQAQEQSGTAWTQLRVPRCRSPSFAACGARALRR